MGDNEMGAINTRYLSNEYNEDEGMSDGNLEDINERYLSQDYNDMEDVVIYQF